MTSYSCHFTQPLSNLPPCHQPHDPLPIPPSCFDRQHAAFSSPFVEKHLPRSLHVREVRMVWVDRFDVERILREAHKVLNVFEDSLHEAVVVGVCLEVRPCNLLHLLFGLGCVVCLQVSGAISLCLDAYHGKPDDTVLRHQCFDQRSMLLAHVCMVLVLVHTRLTIGADCPLEKTLRWLVVGIHVEFTDVCSQCPLHSEWV